MSDPAPHRHAGVTAAERRTVGKVVAATMVVIALVTGLSVVFLYRHYNSNLNVLDVTHAS